MQTDSALRAHSPSFTLPKSGLRRSRLLDRLGVRLFTPVDISFLVFLRVAFGAI